MEENRNEKTNAAVVKRLLKRSDLFAYQKKQFFVFSKSGFTQDVVEVSKSYDNVYLIDFDEMLV